MRHNCGRLQPCRPGPLSALARSTTSTSDPAACLAALPRPRSAAKLHRSRARSGGSAVLVGGGGREVSTPGHAGDKWKRAPATTTTRWERPFPAESAAAQEIPGLIQIPEDSSGPSLTAAREVLGGDQAREVGSKPPWSLSPTMLCMNTESLAACPGTASYARPAAGERACAARKCSQRVVMGPALKGVVISGCSGPEYRSE